MAEGRVLSGRYRLERKLGQGGMGSVWRATHVELGTPAAVKLIDPTIAQSEEALRRFKREAQAAAAIRSPNVVQIFDYGVDGDTPFIAMELLVGQSLAERLAERRRLTPGETATILQFVGRAVQRAHDHGIVHRDLKPDNVYLASDGDEEVVKVLDFGVAKLASALDLTGSPTTRTGAVLGTPYYMSPEQLSGQRAVDARSDLWALAVIACECLTGVRPYEAETLGGLVLAVCTGQPVVPSSLGPVPAGFDAWFARAAARAPEQRHATVREAMADLAAVCGVAPRSGPVSSGESATPLGHTQPLVGLSAPPGPRPSEAPGPAARPDPLLTTTSAAGATAQPTTLSAGERRAGGGRFALVLAGAVLLGASVTGLGWRLLAARSEPSPPPRAAAPPSDARPPAAIAPEAISSATSDTAERPPEAPVTPASAEAPSEADLGPGAAERSADASAGAAPSTSPSVARGAAPPARRPASPQSPAKPATTTTAAPAAPPHDPGSVDRRLGF